MKLLGFIENKTISFNNLPYARHHLEKLEGQKVIITVEKQFNKRSLNQNSLLWMWFTLIAEHTGYSPEEIHVIAKGLYCPRKNVTIRNKTYMIPRGTSDLTKGEMAEFMMYVQSMAADLGVILPSVEDYKKGLDTAILSTE